ncbi:MAG: hypothetical protein P8M80_02455 [Pirellulaceae bacterium]|nr:hypothetical protein [Pirellulaceae bacterium]
MMRQITPSISIGLSLLFCSLVVAEETSIDEALRISNRTGKPIFAIASRKTCQPCQVLKSRVAGLMKDPRIGENVVYLRIDLDHPSWKKWNRKFSYQGRMLPIVYLIRADQKQLYGKSNNLPGAQLKKFISQGIAHSGRSFNERELRHLESANQATETALEENKILQALHQLRSASTIYSQQPQVSYANCAQQTSRLTEMVISRSGSYLNAELQKVTEGLKKNQPYQYQAISRLVRLENSFNGLGELSKKLANMAQVIAANPEMNSLLSSARTIDRANSILNSPVTPAQKNLAMASIVDLQNRTSFESVRTAAKEVIKRNQATLASVAPVNSK